MTKYEPLTRHLAKRPEARISMAFAEIERLLGFPLPRSARTQRPWWANSDHGHVQSKAWLDAGYLASEVDLKAETLKFIRLNAVDRASGMAEGGPAPWGAASGNVTAKAAPTGRHPLIGCMAGTFTILPGVDLSEPVEPDWEEQLLAKFDRLLGHGA